MEKILLGHGSGGRLMHQLIREYFAPKFNLKEFNDSAVVNFPTSLVHPFANSVERQALSVNRTTLLRLAFTTDSYVVSPIFFPGGNIGDLAVNGTVNDISMVGAKPLYLSAGFIIEEGFPINDLKVILSSMSDASQKAGVRIVAGDTKVVDKGKGDGIFINTSGVGIIRDGVELGAKNIKAGDRVIVSGLTGSHGIAVLAERNGLSFAPPVLSDTAPLNGLVDLMLNTSGEIRMMRDPTRGGVATTLKEIAEESGLCIIIEEDLIPVAPCVKGACELLGLDPLYIANEGILAAVVSPDAAEPLLKEMRDYSLGKNASIIGEAISGDTKTCGMVLLKTSIGGTRIIDMLSGEQLPRIC